MLFRTFNFELPAFVDVVVGGIVPDSDLEAMAEAGVAGVLGPGASAEDVAKCVREAVATRGD